MMLADSIRSFRPMSCVHMVDFCPNKLVDRRMQNADMAMLFFKIHLDWAKIKKDKAFTFFVHLKFST